ncbi:voltage-gated potassium channel [Ramaria rubella]|nr:voltage-gated potassium channel [Ramaria rubella]
MHSQIDNLYLKIHTWATVAPLLSAVFAPFSTLFDIPALTEPWFIHFDPTILLDPNKANEFPDRTASIVLSAIGLAFNIIANALLFVRFSANAHWWRLATRMSLVFWISKVIIALVNVSVYGTIPQRAVRGEGFWCAIISLIICGIITFLLIAHWVFEFRTAKKGAQFTDEQLELRLAGRHFMINVTFFVVDVAALALLSSQVEHWTYLQGIYFSVVTFLLIGFGDFYPTHTVTRVLLFFFAIAGIAQLGNIVSMLVTFYNSRTEEKRAVSRAEYETKRQEEEERKPGVSPNIHKEIEFLHELGERQEARFRLQQLGTSLAWLMIFWLVGAVFFSHVEGWPYGTAMYFGYVTFLTLGYGDFAPITAAGRVVFVLYALIAVPVMASFVVQAVQQFFAIVAEREYNRSKAKRGLEPGVSPSISTTVPESEMEKGSRSRKHQTRTHLTYGADVVPHAELAERWNEEWERRVRSHRDEGFSEGAAQKMADVDTEAKMTRENNTTYHQDNNDTANAGGYDTNERREVDGDDRAFVKISTRDVDTSNEEALGEDRFENTDDEGTEEQEQQFDEDARLTERVLELAISLERRARKLLIMHLRDDDGGKAARIVLKADRNVQLREVRGMIKDIKQPQDQDGEKSEVREDEADDELQGSDSVKDVTGASSFLSGARTASILQRILEDDPHDLSFPATKEDQGTLAEVRQYREDFAGLLAAGSRLMGLKGHEKALFERRRVRESKQDAGE